MIRLTAKERVLLHLLDFTKQADAVEVPHELTQEGIARAASFDLAHFSEYVRPTIREGLIRERLAHVKGIRQRRKVYDLTEAGKVQAVRLREKVKAEPVPVRDAHGVHVAPIRKVLDEAGGKSTVLNVVRQIASFGAVDLAALTAAPRPAYVEMVADAPRLSRFVGRDIELEVLTGEDGPRMVVVRGVAGIGKSSLAAKACDLLRGKRNLYWHRVRPWDTYQTVLAGLAEFLTALGRPGLKSVLARGEVHRAAQVLREDLPGTQSFLVFDDAQEATPDALSAFQLVKDAVHGGPGVRAVVLARQSLPFYDVRDVTLRGLVREIDLGGLGPEEITVFFQERGSLAELGSRLGGHPLFLELVRSAPDAIVPSQALSDVRRFIEREIYQNLSNGERRMMKSAALYRVPVPREALYLDKTMTQDILLSLTERSLIRAVGEGQFEVHDTVRDSFAAMLTQAEREEIGRLAVDQLRALADGAMKAGDVVGAINFLSNAVQLPAPPEQRPLLWEPLADASERIGDLPGTLTAYQEAMTETTEREVVARLHRKVASAYERRGELISAMKEIEAGLEALGGSFTVERGWLDLVRSRVVRKRAEYEEAEEDGKSALRLFQAHHVLGGQAQALLLLGTIASMRGTRSPEGTPLADLYFKSALEISDAVGDALFTARLHLTLADHIVYRLGDLDQVGTHFAAIEAIPEAMEDPLFRAQFLYQRGWFRSTIQGDFSGAASDATEATRIARQIRDTATVAYCTYLLACCAVGSGRISEARNRFEEAVGEFSGLGFPRIALHALLWTGECCLAAADIDGFKRVVAALDEPRLTRGEELAPHYANILRGFDRLVDRDYEAARSFFEHSVGTAKSVPAEAESFFIDFGTAHFYSGVALRVMGHDTEATEHINRALEMWRRYGAFGALATAGNRERWLVEGIRRILVAG